MKKFAFAAVAAALVLTPAVASAQIKPIEVRAIRITSEKPADLATFYNTVFGFKKLEGVGNGGAVEMVNGLRLTIAMKQPNTAADPVAHLLFNVANLDGTIAKAKAAGAVVTREPTKSALNNMVAFIRDPGGNIVELIGPVPGATKIN